MRDDMARVIVERPRIPAHNARKGRTSKLEDLPSHQGMRRPHLLHGDGKTLNENLQPLRRYLEGQVGRPWNKVYAEIAANLRVDNTVQQHVRDHLQDFVALQPRRLNHGWRGALDRTLWWQPLYVDPVNGLLCRTARLPEEKARRRRAAQPKPLAEAKPIPLTSNRELRRICGLWYEVQLAPLPEPDYRGYPETQQRRLKSYDPRSAIFEVAVTVRRLVTHTRPRKPTTRVNATEPVQHPIALDGTRFARRSALQGEALHVHQRLAVPASNLRRHRLRSVSMAVAAPSLARPWPSHTALISTLSSFAFWPRGPKTVHKRGGCWRWQRIYNGFAHRGRHDRAG